MNNTIMTIDELIFHIIISKTNKFREYFHFNSGEPKFWHFLRISKKAERLKKSDDLAFFDTRMRAPSQSQKPPL